MAKGIYFGVNDVARKAKKIYFGVNGVARKVKKMYFGVNGVPRLAYSSGLNSGIATPLSGAKQRFASASVGNTGNLVIFASGLYHSPSGSTNMLYSRLAESYDINLTRAIISDSAATLYELTGINNNRYAVFAGGLYFRSSTGMEEADSDVRAYDSSLVQYYPPNLNEPVSDPGGASVADYAIFFGGKRTGQSASQYINTYSQSLTKYTFTQNTVTERYAMASANNSSYAFFAGGLYTPFGAGIATNIAFNATLTKFFPSNLSVGRSYCKGACINNYILIAGGQTDQYTYSNVIDMYDPYLTKIANNISLSVARSFFASASLSTYALFAGGMSSSGAYYNTADIFDANLTLETVPLSSARAWLSSGVVGKYALFAGGCSSSTVESAVVDYFEV